MLLRSLPKLILEFVAVGHVMVQVPPNHKRSFAASLQNLS